MHLGGLGRSGRALGGLFVCVCAIGIMAQPGGAASQPLVTSSASSLAKSGLAAISSLATVSRSIDKVSRSFDLQRDGSALRGGLTPAPARWARAPRPATAGPTFDAQSTNWSGVIDTGSVYSGVGGQWTVPSVQPTASPAYSGTWIGIDGTSIDSSHAGLIQTGTGQNSGPTQYYAWYEIVPAPPQVINQPVAPGDDMAATIIEQSAGLWQISIGDLTKGWAEQGDFTYNGPDTSAEWIEEAPTVNGSQSTLADFGSVGFSDIAAGDPDPAASGLVAVDMINAAGDVIAVPGSFNQAIYSFTITYVGPPPPSAASSGYDLVGRDGGVFVFPGSSPSFYGSLPGLGVHVSNIVGMVPTADDQGYFLVGSDGGVFAFGNAPFLGSLPGLGVHINDVVGIVPTADDRGYFLVGRDGGVFAFGNAPFLGSLPGRGIDVNDIIGIAADASDQGYWLIAANGQVYAFGNAGNFGSAVGSSSPVTAIESTPDGGGYWIVMQNGSVYTFGDAPFYGSLPGLHVTPALPVIGIVPTADGGGYWLIGADGGIFSFGDAPFVGSLPGLGVHVTNIVGAVPTRI